MRKRKRNDISRNDKQCSTIHYMKVMKIVLYSTALRAVRWLKLVMHRSCKCTAVVPSTATAVEQ
jgi:hypothetical protein